MDSLFLITRASTNEKVYNVDSSCLSVCRFRPAVMVFSVILSYPVHDARIPILDLLLSSISKSDITITSLVVLFRPRPRPGHIPIHHNLEQRPGCLQKHQIRH